jgi:hypothetical protein
MRRLFQFVIVAACTAVLLPRAAGAVEIGGPSVTRASDWVAASLRVQNAFSSRIKQSIERGMPVTVVITVDVWQDRTGWFDRLVGEQTVVLRAFRNAWSDDFTLRRDREPERLIADVATLEREISRPMRVRTVPLSRVDPGNRYYVIIRVSVKPLTVEDLETVEKWLSGEAKRSGKPGPGSIARLPRYLVEVLANLSGFGDEVARWRSGMFTLERIPSAP